MITITASVVLPPVGVVLSRAVRWLRQWLKAKPKKVNFWRMSEYLRTAEAAYKIKIKSFLRACDSAARSRKALAMKILNVIRGVFSVAVLIYLRCRVKELGTIADKPESRLI
jgi:hypothetical protein